MTGTVVRGKPYDRVEAGYEGERPPCLAASKIYLERITVPDNIFKLEIQLLPDAFQGGPVLAERLPSNMAALQP